jgi:hypothetical protein
VSRPETAALSSGTMATSTGAALTMCPYDASLDDVDARAEEQLDEAAREDFEGSGTIADAVMVVARGKRRDLG